MKRLVALIFVVALTGAAVRPVSENSEVARLRAHFDTVLAELRAADISGLSPRQLAERVRHIKRLAAYSEAGAFPKNRDFAERTPYFIDRDGTRCAMAYLIEQSGAGDYVRQVSSRMNNAYVPEIARDPVLGAPLAAWLEANGLTAAEAARIQPSYGGGGCCTVDPSPSDPKVTTEYKVGSGAAIVGGLGSLLLNLSTAHLGLSARTQGWLGVGTGALGLALGAVALGQGDSYATLGLLDGGIGAVALAAGVQALLKNEAPRTLAVVPAYGAGGRRGLMLSLAF